jgi:ubiquinone/menaquinone biosynthesis C-methylase UbiE
MAVADSVFAASIAARYDTVLGPFMFEPFARETASRLMGFAGDVLEIAAGTGVVTRELDRALAASSRIVATDLNAPMLEVAAARLTSPRVTWRQADALSLPFEDAAFDAAVCQFGVMFYPDPLAGHREAARVLRPAGRYVLSVWDDLASNAVAETVQRCVAARFAQDPPLFLARTPHGHADTGKLRGDIVQAGFPDVAIETITLEAGRLTADQLAVGFCQGTPLRHEIETRDAAGLEATTLAVADALRERFGDGAVESTICAHLITAVR